MCISVIDPKKSRLVWGDFGHTNFMHSILLAQSGLFIYITLTLKIIIVNWSNLSAIILNPNNFCWLTSKFKFWFSENIIRKSKRHLDKVTFEKVNFESAYQSKKVYFRLMWKQMKFYGLQCVDSSEETIQMCSLK